MSDPLSDRAPTVLARPGLRTVLLYTSPALGHLYPMMDVALGLRAAGHRVVVQTLAGQRDVVEDAGLEHREIAPEIEAIRLRDYQRKGALGQVRAAFDAWLARAPHEIEDLRRAEAECSPDFLLVDTNTWGAAAFAERWATDRGRPWAAFLPYPLPTPDRNVPAFGPGFAPPRNALDRTRDRIVRGLTRRAVRDPVRRLNELRAGIGAPPLASYEDLFLRAPGLLYRTAPPFDYERAVWPPSVHPIGPGLWAPPAEAPAWLHELPRPRTLVSVSTELQEDGMIIETALRALADEPGSMIVTTSALDPERFTAPNERVRIVRFVPHAAVVPEVDGVVTHGGMGTTQRALAAGVPVCVVPWGRDQAEAAMRAKVAGTGTIVPRGRLTPERLRAAVRDARTRAPAAQRIAHAFRAAGGAERAVALIEGWLGERAAGDRPAVVAEGPVAGAGYDASVSSRSANARIASGT